MPYGLLPYMVKKPAPVVGQPSDLSCVNQVLAMLYHRRPAVVEANKAHYAGLTRHALDGCRFLRTAPDRFFTKYMFTGRGYCLHHLLMQEVGRGNVDDLNVRVSDDLMPVGRRLGEPQRTSGLLRPVRNIVGANHQPRPDAAVVETVVHQPIRAAMSRAHPTHADNAYPDLLSHLYLACLTSLRFGQVKPAPAAERGQRKL